MYDQHFFPEDQSYPELDDPAFWGEIASQVDTTALLYPPVQTPRYPSDPQQPYQYPTTERLWLPAPQPTQTVVAVPAETEEEMRDTDVQAPGTTGQPTQTQKQNIWLPFILIGLAAILLLTVFGTTTTGSRFIDTTPEVAGTWNVHCHQGTPAGAGGSSSITGPATIDADFINKVLEYYHSPMAGQGQLFVQVSQYCGLDPAFVLAFYMHESSFGLGGEARYSLSPGNLRCIPGVRCQDGYAWFESWQDGLMVQCRLLRNLYVDGWGLTTPEQIIPKYAPAADNNNEAAYEYALEHAVSTWRQHIVAVS
ncbi:hypothetical protein KDA_75720 [Dictyobacter alpinus]|uniref:Mannosyl-glycoprotein endo-beta-N-acetylglucosamidase-like domain-containing protein n=1 Tax=Dictyobacter alpinus TaxID=2014873 RepID=A0A402BL46_9CHLR|nr:glucosaminidase domain-containing protein [Dictyobacter alpinus]GCE32088.1 hypothetical protein KDA_75720 [Dictyobacter alpinus]